MTYSTSLTVSEATLFWSYYYCIMRNRVSFCYITIWQNPMGLSKYYETIKFFSLGHPWAFKNLWNFRGEDFGICLSSHELSLPQNTRSSLPSGTEYILEWGGHEKQRMSYDGTFSKSSDGINCSAQQ